MDGDGPAFLYHVVAVALGIDGKIFVAEGDGGIKAFDRAGRYVEHLAREGEGPGEVRWVTALTAGPRGEVAVYDLGNNRITVLYPDGEVDTFRRPDGTARRGEDALAFHLDGTLWVGIHPWFSSGSGTIQYPRPIFARLDLQTGALVDTVFAPTRIGDRCPLLSAREYRVGVWEDKREPFLPKGQWALGLNGVIALGCPSAFEFELVKPPGDVVRITRAWEPLAILDEEREFYAGWQPLPPLPETRPAYARIIIPGDGRVWVWPNQAGELRDVPGDIARATGVTKAWRLGSEGAFEVFGEDGRWRGRVELPQEVRYSGFPTYPPIVIRGDTVLAIARDSLDVESVVRYLVEWPEGGGS